MMYGKSQMSMLIGEFTPDCLTIRVAKSLGGYEVSLLQRKLRDGSLNGEISTPEGGADRDRKLRIDHNTKESNSKFLGSKSIFTPHANG